MGKKKRKKKLFRVLFLLYTTALLCAAGVLLYQLYGRLKEYQEGVDAERYSEEVSRAPQAAFEEYVSGLTAETLTAFWFREHPGSFDDRGKVEEYWSRRLQGAKAYKDAEYTSEAPVFLLADDEGVFARFPVGGEGLNREVQEPVFSEQRFSACFVETLDRNEVYCAGERLTEDYITRRDICSGEADYAEELVNPVSRVRYEIALLIPEPDFEVLNATPYEMRTLSDGQIYYTLKDEEGSPLQEYAGELVRSLLDFYLLGSENAGENMSAALSYVEKGSAAYHIIKGSYNSVIWRRIIRDSETELSFAPVIVWADNCVSVDVSYHTVKSKSPENVIADGTYRIFFYDFGDGFKVYDLTLI